MAVLGLDLGIKTGVHISVDSHAYTINNRIKGDTRGCFYHLFEHLEEVLGSNPVKVIAFEEAAFQQGKAISYYHGFAAIVYLIGDLWGVPVIAIPVGTIKKATTGKGNADKKEIMDVVSKLGYTFDDNNAADAIAVNLTYGELYCNINDTDKER